MRNDHAATLEAGEPVALTAVVLLDLIREVFADVMFADRQSAVVRLIVVGAVKQDFPSLQALQQAV